MNEGVEQLARTRLSEGRGLLESMLTGDGSAQIAAVAELITAAYRRGAKLLLFGNGGSAADAAHVAAELVGRYQLDRRPLPAIELVGNPATVTALANDFGFEDVFARQVRALGEPGDVALGFTTSGRSTNVVRALEAARSEGIETVAMTGLDPGPVGATAGLLLTVPSSSTPRIQEAHIFASHIICEWVEARIAEADPDL